MELIYAALLLLVIFAAIWMFVVAPSERKHHERKLEAVQRKIADREAAARQKNEDQA